MLSVSIVFMVALMAGIQQQMRSPNFCGLCHMMKPELYTWQASSHSKVACVTCHVPPGIDNYLKFNLNMVKEFVLAVTGTYTSPIRMMGAIPSESCKECHNMDNRRTTVSGDLIIPHDLHEKKGIACAKCHKGIAHGNILERRVTYSSDYGRWNEAVGKSMMSDNKFVAPDMDTCMRCHKLKRVSLSCETCHTTVMIPQDHQDKDFKYGKHGKIASKDLVYCNNCHQYMTEVQVEGLKELPKFLEVLKKDQGAIPVTPATYAKANTFCKDCHSKRPPSHKVDLFMMNHGELASKDKTKCSTCHNLNYVGNSAASQVSCNSCHPSSHQPGWKDRHPVHIPPNVKVDQNCYTCHNKETCIGCHR